MTPTALCTLYSTRITTPLGTLYSMSDNHHLYGLLFEQQRHFHRICTRLLHSCKGTLQDGTTQISTELTDKIYAYFKGTLSNITIPYVLHGTPFQRHVWQHLTTIPFGITISYKALAHASGYPTAYRAVAGAVGANPLTLIIPCHRIIGADGTLGGYAGGIHRKQWLLRHEAILIP